MSSKFDPSNKTCKEKGCVRLYGNHCHARDNGKFLLFGGREYPDCEFFEARKKPTVFDRLTQSPEVLAPYCISTKPSINGDTLYYYSTVTSCIYLTEAAAIAATVAKLKEVNNG